MVPAYGRETWTVDPATVAATGAAMGVDLVKPAVITPNQARKAGLAPDVVASLAHTPQAGSKLKPVDASAAAKAFS
jgi:hypothetical protein